MSGKEKGTLSRVRRPPSGGAWTALSHLLYLCLAPGGLTRFPKLHARGPATGLWPWGHSVPHSHAHAPPPLPRALRTPHPLTVYIRLVDGDHALGLGKETERH